MSIPSAWSLSNHWHYHPLSHLLSISQIQEIQIIGSKRPTACCASVHDHLKRIDSTASMCSSWRRRNAGALKLLPLECEHAKRIHITSDYVFTRVSSCSSEQDDFRFGHLCNRMTKSGQRHFTKCVNAFLFIRHFVLQ